MPTTLDHQRKLAELIQRRDALDAAYAKDPWRWLCQQVVTRDESADGAVSKRLRRWPQDKPYLKEVLSILRNEQLTIIPKSRRMLVTWLVAGWLLHATRYEKAAANFIISEVEQKAAFVVDFRCHFMELNLRHEEFRRQPETLKTKTGLVGRLTYPEQGSFLWGLASSSDVLRTYTASKFVIDEIEFIENAPALVRAAIPLLEHGAQGVFVSSSNGPVGVVAEYCREVGFTKWSDMMSLDGERIAYAS